MDQKIVVYNSTITAQTNHPMMFMNPSIVSSALLLLLLGSACCYLVAAEIDADPLPVIQTDPRCDFSPDALTKAYGKSVPRTCIDVPFDNGVTTGVMERCYYTYVPDNESCSDREVPLVFDIHGLTDCPLMVGNYSGWRQKAERDCFVVVWPSGFVDEGFEFAASCWNNRGYAQSYDFGTEGGNNVTTTPCCCVDEEGSTDHEEPHDPLFLKMAIDNVVESFDTASETTDETNGEKLLTIDTDRIYIAGHSNGCITGLAMAALYSDTIAAVCCHAGTIVTPFALDYSPVPIWLVHGEQDPTIPYNGQVLGELPPPIGKIGLWGNPQVRDYISNKNECTEEYGETAVSDENGVVHGTLFKGTNCKQSIEVVVLTEAGHFPYDSSEFDHGPQPYGGSRTTIDTTELAWEFCSARVRQSPGLTSFPTEKTFLSSGTNALVSAISASTLGLFFIVVFIFIV